MVIRSVIISFLVSMVIGGLVYYLINNDKKKIVVVDAVKLFNGYSMKKELEKESAVKLEFIGKRVDSISNQIKLMKNSTDNQQKETMQRIFQIENMRLEKVYAETNKAINEQVWKRLNPLMKEYGEKNHLKLMIGANGMGTVLYNEEGIDLTDDMIRFVNKKYESGN